MSLENKIEELTKAILTLNANLEKLSIPTQIEIPTEKPVEKKTKEPKQPVEKIEKIARKAIQKESEPVKEEKSETITHDELKKLFISLVRVDSSKKTKLKELLAEYDAMKVSDVATHDLEEVKKRAEEI